MSSRLIPSLAALAVAALLAFGCGGDRRDEVVIYTAHDREFSEPILRLFEERTGIAVRPVYDTEAVKTVGLVNRLIAERARPQADVFWNNEILRSMQLKAEGITEPFDVPNGASMPAGFRDPDGHWVGFGARARVIMVNTEVVPNEADHPTRIADLVDPRWRGRAGFASPLFGTTSTHAAIQFADDPEAARAFWRAAMDNAVMMGGNKQAAQAVASGELAWCMTDTDDAFVEMEQGFPVRMIYPDAAEGGTVLLPNTVVRIAGGPNPEGARELLDFLLSPEVEQLLAESLAAQIPVRPGVPGPPTLPPFPEEAVRQIDWTRVEPVLAESADYLARLIGGQ